MSTFTFRVDDTLKDAFSTAAKGHDRTGAQLLRDFMRDYVQQQQAADDHDVWFRQQVEAGRTSADRGDVITSADVEARFAAKRAETRRKLGESAS